MEARRYRVNDETPVPFTTSACDRVLTAIRTYRRQHGRSPSLGEIARRASVRRQHVGRYLVRLQIAGLLVYDRHASEAIILTDPTANLSDIDLEAGCHGRGWTVIKSAAPEMASAFPVDPLVPNWELPLLKKLSQID
jgi:hypothetical protein